MANRFWVGGTASWDATAGSKWATTSGGGGGAAVPTAADDVFFDAASTGNCTLSSSSVCRSLNTTGFTGTITHPASVTVNIGDATAGASNVALAMGTGTTYAPGSGSSSIFQFVSTSNTVQTILPKAASNMGALTFNGAGGRWKFTGPCLQSSSGVVIFTNGEVDTNGQTITWGVVSLGVGTKSLIFGASTINILGTGLNFQTNATGLTLDAGTSSIVFNPTASITPAFSSGTGLTWYDITVIKSSGGFAPSCPAAATVTVHSITQDNTVVGGGNRVLQFTANSTWNINGTLTYKANNAHNARGSLRPSAQGVPTILALGATGTAALTDIDIEDITFTGTNTPVTAAGGSRLGDMGGNSGITFDAPVTYYWIGNGGDINQTAHWSLTSGGATAGVIPLVHDTAIFDANSISSGGQTVNNGLMRSPGLDFSAVTNNPTYNPINPNGAGNIIVGSLILKAGMAFTCTGAAGGATGHNFRKRTGTSYIDHAGNDQPSNVSTTIAAPGGVYQLLDDLITSNSGGFIITAGEFDANDFDVTAVLISSSNANTRTIRMGSGTWTVTGSGTIWSMTTTTGLTLDSETSLLIVNDNTASTKNLTGAFLELYDVEIMAGSGIVAFNNSWTVHDLTLHGQRTVQFNAGITFTIEGEFYPLGTAGNIVTIQSSSSTNHNLTKASGMVAGDYLSISDSNAVGGAVWYAGANSTDAGGSNSGWIFTAPLPNEDNFFAMF